MADKQISEADQKLLDELDQKGRDLVKRVMDQHPELTVAEAIEHCQEMGGL
jgi:hypothetical protein